jgi:hypothetical protein
MWIGKEWTGIQGTMKEITYKNCRKPHKKKES